jgi:hypothetical protein
MKYVGINLPTRYNCTMHETLDYSPHKLVFSQSPRTPTSLLNKNEYTAYGKYVTELGDNLRLGTNIVALNIVQIKYRPKYYYDKKLNTGHFRDGELVYTLKKLCKGKLKLKKTNIMNSKHFQLILLQYIYIVMYRYIRCHKYWNSKLRFSLLMLS